MDRLTERGTLDGKETIKIGSTLYFGEQNPSLFVALDKLAHYEDLAEQGRLMEQKNGIWVKKHNEKAWTHYTYSCSICDGGSDCVTNYCPNCGAKMDEVKDERKID